MQFSIKNQTRQAVPKVGFQNIAERVLGKRYELSLVFVGQATSRRFNRTSRGKDKPTNVLSFPLSKTSGEIFFDLVQVKKEYKKFDMPYVKFVTFLFIHALLHLKGMQHGAKMERAERKLLKDVFLNNNGKTNNSGY